MAPNEGFGKAQCFPQPFLSTSRTLFPFGLAFSLGLHVNHVACGVLVAELEREPYAVTLFKQAAVLLATYGIDESVESRYHSAVARANGLARQGNAALLNNQEAMEETS